MAALLTLVFTLIAFLVFAAAASGQTVDTARSRTVGREREHRRIERTSMPGRHIELASLKGAALYVPPDIRLDRPVPLIVHFHGSPWLIEQHIQEKLPRTLLITVQLGAGSSVYGRPFADEALFSKVIDEAREAAGARKGWSSITLSGFSAGYGAIRAILRHKPLFTRIGGVLLLDGFHASYEPEGKPLWVEGVVSRRDIDSFIDFAREAVKGRKYFVITHSQIHPGTYASTTECTNALLRELGVERRMSIAAGPMGMKLLSVGSKGRFRVFGYAGETGADHVDHLHAMPFWFGFLGVR